MTISSTTRIAGPFVGNGTATVFPFTFKVFAAADLDVVRLNISTGVETTLVLNSDYSVTLNGDQNSNPGGSITLLAGALATGSTLVITSDIANLQPTDLTNQGGFYPEVITDALDRATIQIQQISDIGDRTLKIPITDGSLNMELPTAAERANSFLSFDANGLPSVVTAGSSGAPATITRQVFSGTGSQTVFTLASDPGALGNSAQVYIGGVYQQRSTYTIAGTTLTFSAAPVAGTDNIEFVNFLTSSIGATSADLVTYTPAGSGAVARSAASKFGDTVSVKDFGAVGDGVTDDTAAFQNAIAYAQTRSALGGGTIIVPSGRYALTSLIITSSIAIIGEEISSELIFNTTGAAISYQPTYATQSLRMTISGLAFSNVTNVPSSFIEIGGGTQDAVNTVIERCHFTSSSATWCIDNNRAYGTYIFMCVFADIAGGGVLLRQNAGLTDYSFVAKIEKCDFTRTTSNAIRTQGGGPTYIDGCVVQGITTGATGVLVGDGFAALGTTIQNSWFELNTGNDIEAVAGNTHTILVINTTFNGTPVIALGSTGKLLAIGVNSGGGGNICTVSGSGSAQAFLLGASNFVQSGTFDWTSLGYSGQNATTSSATLTFRNTADFNYVLTNQTSTVSRVGNVVDVFFTVTMTRNQIDASNFKLYITGFAPAITGTNYLAGQVSITGSDTFNGPLENLNNNGFVTLTDVFSAGASGRAWNLSGQLRYLTTP